VKKLLRLRLRRRCIVTLKTGDSFSGVLYDADAEAIVLREAEAVGMGEKRTNLVVDGEVLILRDDVAYVQLP
jgi:small nuclear ribonucleoprotein (snRNP)-like protein